MCGFAGEFMLRPTGRADLAAARRMADALAHRGPDQQGEFLSDDGRCAIAFRRLAVIDPPGSPQPMTSADGELTVAFNGEIYNYRQLREQLAAAGCRFRSAGDTEVLLHLYRARGAEMAAALDGMFAFALYDRRTPSLLLVRDRLGQKPLWVRRMADRLVFASEARGLLAHPIPVEGAERNAVTHYFTLGYVPQPHSIWKNIEKQPPGTVVYATDAPNMKRCWKVPEDEHDEPPEGVGAVRGAVAAAVGARMHADVPLGVLLSGGIDSGIVAALMAREAGRAGGVRTFTAGFEDETYDERPLARKVAGHIGSEHTELLVRAAPAEAVDELVRMYAEPFADSSALPTWLICRAAREHVTVALCGDGGDEVFGGYDRYRALRLASELGPLGYAAARVCAGLLGPFASQEERSRLRRFVRFAEALPDPPAVQYFRHRCLFTPEELRRLFTDDFADACDLDAPMRWFVDLYEDCDLGSEVARAQRHDLLTYLPDDLLVKADVASMAASLELRSPFLDHRLVERGLSLPVERKVSRRQGKVVLREAFADLLPIEVLRGRKRGFGVPLSRWLREDLFEMLRETLMDPGLHRRGIFRPESLAGLLNDHFSGKGDHRHRLWALLVFARWLSANGVPGL